MTILAESAIFAVILIYPTWLIFGRAGFHPALSLLLFVPGIGLLIVLFILGFVAWPATKRRVDAAGEDAQWYTRSRLSCPSSS
jgi:hypothetical protein